MPGLRLAFVLSSTSLMTLIGGNLFISSASSTALSDKAAKLSRQAGWQEAKSSLRGRSDSPTDACFRTSQQSGIVNGTLYLYGGRAYSTSQQIENTWNNDFLTLDLTETWQIETPPLAGLPQPSGPPAVADGALWTSHESLYLYGGEYSSSPPKMPDPFVLWEYQISSKSWIEHDNPVTSNGTNAPGNNQSVFRAAEGAGVSVPGLGRGFYFGGHLDLYTTPGWSEETPREYLQSLLEFTFPTFSNDQVDSLHSGNEAGEDGVFRNITIGGLQSSAGFTERADGLLIFVPGFGKHGILVALAGGTGSTFTQMNNLDIFDIATSSWYGQATSGPTPNVRVNPCAVIAAAPDGSSYNIYMYGGQNLIPFGNQTQYDDMWILTIPSFTWISVNQTGQSAPLGRSGHTCNIWNGQMIMVGGYTGGQLSCESPGIYVFDLTSLQWVEQFEARSPGSGMQENTATVIIARSGLNSTGANNPFNQQPAQLFNSTNSGGLEGSFGYAVPDAVVSVVGGGPTGGATVTAPIVTATSGPLATGQPIIYSLPNASTSAISSARAEKSSIAAIVVSVICGVLAIAVCYLAFCAYIYRKQLRLHKERSAMSQFDIGGDKSSIVANAARIGMSSPYMKSEARTSYNSSYYRSSTNTSPGYPTVATEVYGPYQHIRRGSNASSVEDLLVANEPTFVGVMLNPRRTLRVINRD